MYRADLVSMDIARPRLAVIGVGDYFRKLSPWLRCFFAPIALVDIDPTAIMGLDDHDRKIFSTVEQITGLSEAIQDAQIVLILTPNETHVPIALQLANSATAIVVEKPVAISSEGLRELQSLVDAGVPVYFSDFYVDVRSTPLLWVRHLLAPNDWRLPLIRGRENALTELRDFGAERRIHGRIFEAYPFRADSWLGRKSSGGVIFDMMIHLFALLNRLYPSEEIEVTHCTNRAFHNPVTAPHVVTPIADAAESYAQIEGRLKAANIQVLFEVAKGQPREERFFAIYSDGGVLTQRYQAHHPLNMKKNGQSCQLTLDGDRYELMCRAVLHWFLHDRRPYGWRWSRWATEQAIQVRQLCDVKREGLNVDD